jgi:N-hydroxyarylamine O-acetyltransferase
MTAAFDLDAYLRRIGYAGERTPTLATLRAIHRLHPQAIPFENLNPLARWPVRLDLASLEQKLVRERRGGYCYEHNLLFSHALRALGFEVTWLAARALWNVPEGVIRPRTHMLLLVDLDDEAFIADVGFGGLTLTAPLRLEADLEQATPHEPVRLKEAGDSYVMEARIGGAWMDLYQFDLQEQLLVDYEMASWYVANHPDSFFVTMLIAARADADRRYALRNTDFAVHHVDGATERRVLVSVEEIRAALADVFQIAVPDAPQLDAALERVVAAAALSAV